MLSEDRRALEHQGRLARVIQDEAREDHRGPGEPDRPGAEMAHVRVKRLGTRNAQKDPSEDEKSGTSAGEEIADPVAWIDREEDRGVPRNAPDPEQRDRREPKRHDRAERPADAGSPLGLDREQRHEDQNRGGEHIGGEGRKHDVQPLQRREHGNRRRDRPVAVDQRRAEKTDRDDDGAMLTLHAKQRHQRDDAAFAVIVDAHRNGHVFDRRHHDQGPDDERQHAECYRRVRARRR